MYQATNVSMMNCNKYDEYRGMSIQGCTSLTWVPPCPEHKLPAHWRIRTSLYRQRQSSSYNTQHRITAYTHTGLRAIPEHTPIYISYDGTYAYTTVKTLYSKRTTKDDAYTQDKAKHKITQRIIQRVKQVFSSK